MGAALARHHAPARGSRQFRQPARHQAFDVLQPVEQAQLDDLIRSNVIRFVEWLGKAGNDQDPKDSFAAAYRKCKEGVKILEENIRADIASGKRTVGR